MCYINLLYTNYKSCVIYSMNLKNTKIITLISNEHKNIEYLYGTEAIKYMYSSVV